MLFSSCPARERGALRAANVILCRVLAYSTRHAYAVALFCVHVRRDVVFALRVVYIYARLTYRQRKTPHRRVGEGFLCLRIALRATSEGELRSTHAVMVHIIMSGVKRLFSSPSNI